MVLIRKAVAAGLLCMISQQAAAITLQFDYSYDAGGFFDTQAKKDILSDAGAFFSGIIQDDLLAINSAGSNHFNATFSNPATGATQTVNDFSVAADTLIVYAGGRALASTTLGVGGFGGYSISGTTTFINNALSRGETGDTQGATATDFAPWGGSIAFNTSPTSGWYFDSDVSTFESTGGTNDFYSVALHELGHLLGLGTADSWDNLISGSDFTGAASTGVYGGNVPLDAGTNGAHWANGTLSLVDGLSQEAAMDPSITTGTRKVFTDLDVAALTDVGWEVSAVPVPAAVWLFGSGLLGLVAVARRRA